MQEPEPEEEMSENAPTTPETPANPPGKRRRWLKILLISVAVVVVGAVAASAAYIYSIDRSVTQNIKREDALPAESPTGAGQSARPTADPDATGAMNFVLLGSDSRDPGDAGAGRSDSIMVVHLNKAHDQAYITSFPRDMWVDIPGHGKGKINAAFAYGGTQLMVQTLESLLGTRMDHVVMVDFEGFIKLTESLGGVTVKNKTAFSSHGFDYPKGQITIAGEQALWFVRERHSLPGGDLDRAENQRNVIKAIVAKGLSPEIVANPTAFTAFISGVAEHVTVDSSLSDQIIRDLALSLRLTASDIQLLQAPLSGFGTSPDGQSIDLVNQAQLEALGKAMKKDTMAAYVEKYADQ
jgi:polyisoprenyl-teichoic acid--peptidoglycan teichoic acid transferase